MACKYSNKTIAAFARFLDAKFTHARKDVLFLSASVPEEFDIGGGAGVSGMRRAFGVVTNLAKRPELEDTLDNLFNEAITEGIYTSGRYNDKPTEELLRALKLDFGHLRMEPFPIRQGRTDATQKLGKVEWGSRHHEFILTFCAL